MKNFNLPEDYRPYIDKYFLRSKEILQKEKLNPTVTLQVFIRNANCKIYGIDEAIAIINKYAPKAKIWSMKEGDFSGNCDTIMLLKARVQDIIDLETMYLGVISAETTIQNDKTEINLSEITERVSKIVELTKRPIMYMGARHWSYDSDADISKACFKGGATACSTDIGAKTNNAEGVGTIPHALEAIYHWKYGIENAVYCAVHDFDEHMEEKIPRIALVDYANREVLDSLVVSREIENLWGIRIDTCGENYMQGIMPSNLSQDFINPHTKGVSLSGVYLLRKILNDADFEHIKIILSSGFANIQKVETFVEAEKELKIKLFDSLGVGQVFHSRCATGDIVEVEGKQIHKAGRVHKESKRLVRIV